MIVLSPLAFLTSIILTLGLATFALFLGTLIYEAAERRQAVRWRAMAARYEEPVALLVAGELAPAALLGQVRAPDRVAVTELLLSYAVHVHLAEEQEQLVAVFQGLGAVERCLRESRDWRWWVRTGAARRLGQMRDPGTIDRLRALLRDPHPEVRTAALWSISQFDLPIPAEVFAQALGSGYLVSSLRVATLFLAAGRRVVPALRAFLERPSSPEAQAQAIRLAGELHALETEPAVLAAVDSPAVAVRREACAALGRLESLGALAALVGALRDPAWQVRAAAAEALGRMGDPAAVPELAPLLAETTPRALLAVAQALRELGPAGLAALRERVGALASAAAQAVVAKSVAAEAVATEAAATEAVTAGPPLALRGLDQQILAEVLAEVKA